MGIIDKFIVRDYINASYLANCEFWTLAQFTTVVRNIVALLIALEGG